MNLSEFKAWFEGFTEDMDKPPTAKQWKRVKARVEEITSEPTPWPVFVERYFQPYRRYYSEPQWSYTTTCESPSDTVTNNRGAQLAASNASFTEAGRAEARSIA